MTISKKDYIQIAKILKQEFKNAYIKDEIHEENQKASPVVAEIYWKLIDYFESENPSFNRDVFEKATTINHEQIKKKLNQ